jgi:hypothetical protein
MTEEEKGKEFKEWKAEVSAEFMEYMREGM